VDHSHRTPRLLHLAMTVGTSKDSMMCRFVNILVTSHLGLAEALEQVTGERA
jgi:hypothetical protein